VYLDLGYLVFLGDLHKLITDVNLSARRLPETVLDEHEEATLDFVCYKDVIRFGVGIKAQDLNIKDLVLGVLEVELLRVSKVRADTLEGFPHLLMDQVHHAGSQSLQRDYLELRRLLLRP